MPASPARRHAWRVPPASAYTLAALAAALYLAFGLAGAWAAGSCWDDQAHRNYAAWVLQWYRAPDLESPSQQRMRQYGASFGMLGAGVERLLPGLDPIRTRHALAAAVSAVALLFAFRIAADRAGPWVGLLALLILATTPPWTGHAFFNPIDTPFAAGHTAAVFYLLRLLDRLPAPRPSDWVKCGVACGLALSVRIGGLLLPCYLFAGLVFWLASPGPRAGAEPGAGRRLWARLAAGGAAVVALTLAVAGLFWPYLLTDPIGHGLALLETSMAFPWPGELLFAGESLRSEQVPARYLATWLAISSPPALAAGALLLLVRAPRRLRRAPRASSAVLLLAVLFPPAFVAWRGSTVYDGLRHFLFLLPLLSVLAAEGWALALRAARARRRAWLPALALALALAEPLVWYARSFPLTYTYFAPWVGGLARASHRYDSDYWGVSLRQAAEWLDAHRDELAAPGAPLVVLTNAPWQLLSPWFEAPERVVRAGRADDPSVHAVVEWYRRSAWGDPGELLFEFRLVDGQRPFFRIYRGPAAGAASR